MNGILEFNCPTTYNVTPMAHIMFKVCLANICPRLGSRSNFSCQDLIVVAMLLSGKKFNLSDLILKNMNDVFEGNQSTGLPYGLLLTRFFEFYGVDLREAEKVVVKEFLDAKNLAQSHLKVDKDGNLVQIEVVTPTIAAGVDNQSNEYVLGKFEKLAKELRDESTGLSVDVGHLTQKIDSLIDEVKILREFVIGKAATESQPVGKSSDVTGCNLTGLANAAVKSLEQDINQIKVGGSNVAHEKVGAAAEQFADNEEDAAQDDLD